MQQSLNIELNRADRGLEVVGNLSREQHCCPKYRLSLPLRQQLGVVNKEVEGHWASETLDRLVLECELSLVLQLDLRFSIFLSPSQFNSSEHIIIKVSF